MWSENFQIYKLVLEKVLGKWKWKSLSCVQLCDPIDYKVNGILQARIL